MNAWLQWLVVAIVLGRIGRVTSQPGELSVYFATLKIENARRLTSQMKSNMFILRQLGIKCVYLTIAFVSDPCHVRLCLIPSPHLSEHWPNSPCN